MPGSNGRRARPIAAHTYKHTDAKNGKMLQTFRSLGAYKKYAPYDRFSLVLDFAAGYRVALLTFIETKTSTLKKRGEKEREREKGRERKGDGRS